MRIGTFALLIWFTACATPPREVADPLLTDFIAAYDDGAVAGFEQFCSNRYAPQRLAVDEQVVGGCAARWVQLRQTFGPARYDRTEQRSFGAMHWFKSESIGVWFGVAFMLDANGAVVGQALDQGVIPSFTSLEPPIASTRVARWTSDYVRGLANDDTFSGVIAIQLDGHDPIIRGIGFAEPGMRNTPDTRFRLASVSKMFTAAAALSLVDDGRLTLDDTFDRYIPDYPRAASATVTVRHLLTHTSGIEFDDSPAYNAAVREALNVDAIVSAQIAHYAEMNEGRAAAFQPLNVFDYSNDDYHLLGAIVQSVAREPWDAAMQRLVFVPAGMDEVRANAASAAAATGYTLRLSADTPRLGFTPRSNAALVGQRATPAGSYFATARDVLSFLSWVSIKSRVEGSSFADAIRIHAGAAEDPTMDVRSGYGLGFQVEETSCGSSFGHDGAAPGVSASARRWPERGLSVVVLANRDEVAPHVLRYLGMRLASCVRIP